MVRVSFLHLGHWDDTGKGPDTVPHTRQMLNKCQSSSLSPTCLSAPAKLDSHCTLLWLSHLHASVLGAPLSSEVSLSILLQAKFKLPSSRKISQIIPAEMIAPPLRNPIPVPLAPPCLAPIMHCLRVLLFLCTSLINLIKIMASAPVTDSREVKNGL